MDQILELFTLPFFDQCDVFPGIKYRKAWLVSVDTWIMEPCNRGVKAEKRLGLRVKYVLAIF